jgi:uncharacterized protein (DUF697 family)
MRSSVFGAAHTYQKLRATLNLGAVQAGARRPFRFLLCGDPGLLAAFRYAMLSGQASDAIPFDAASTLETLPTTSSVPIDLADAKAVVFFGRAGDRTGARLEPLCDLKLPIFALTVDPEATAAGPLAAPRPGEIADYVVPAVELDALRSRFLPHLIDVCKGIEIAVGRRLPALRPTVAAKLTRDAALNALKVAGASAVIDHVPVLGVVLGAFASAGDMVAITGIQMMLMLQISATFGKDPDMGRMWELLPIVGGGFGFRALARELSGFIPVGGILIKSAIAYAGTVVIGEGATFYEQHGRHMTSTDASKIYDDAKTSAMQFARDMFARLGRNGNGTGE